MGTSWTTSSCLLQMSTMLIAVHWQSGAKPWLTKAQDLVLFLFIGWNSWSFVLALLGALLGGAVWAVSERAHMGPAPSMQRHQGHFWSSCLTFTEHRPLNFPWLSQLWSCLSAPFIGIKFHLCEIDAVLIFTLWLNLYVSLSHKSVVMRREHFGRKTSCY